MQELMRELRIIWKRKNYFNFLKKPIKANISLFVRNAFPTNFYKNLIKRQATFKALL